MTSHPHALRLIAPEPNGSLASAIGELLLSREGCTRPDAGGANALLVDAFDDTEGGEVLVLDDARFDAAFVAATLARVARLQDGMARLGRPANIVVIASDAYLGRWHAVAQAAASAAMIGIVRSIAVEQANTGLRVNMLALPFATRADDLVLIEDAANQALDLLTTRSINGETILLDSGNNLKFRQARRR